MSAESKSIAYASTDDAVPVVDASDVEMVSVSDAIGAKTTRNVQTQHGDYRSVDEENIFLIAKCLWPEVEEDKSLTAPQATTSSSSEAVSIKAEEERKDQEEQVVWIEPFADEVSFSNERISSMNARTSFPSKARIYLQFGITLRFLFVLWTKKWFHLNQICRKMPQKNWPGEKHAIFYYFRIAHMWHENVELNENF